MLTAAAVLPAQETASPLRSGLDLFGKSNFSEALRHFRDVILDPSQERLHPAAYYWTARSYLAMEDLDRAEKSLEFYLLNYPEDTQYPDAYYQKGRLLFLQKEYEKSIRVLYDFIETYPDHPLLANAYFWIGESLFSLGALEDARRVFSLIPEKFPSSVKVTAAQYRVSLIALKEREEVLLNMLQMSHEEYIKALEDFQTRERTYKQALDIYQRKLAEAATADKDQVILSLRSELSSFKEEKTALEDEVLTLETKIASLKEQLDKAASDLAAAGSASPPPAEEEDQPPVEEAPPLTGSGAEQLLELKSRTLAIKEYYLDWLMTEMEAGR